MELGAVGKVVDGFSKPYGAIYEASAGNVTYKNGRILARGVSVALTPNASSDNTFYADNQAAESSPTIFTGADISLGIDGLLIDAEQFVNGLPTKDKDGWVKVGDNLKNNYLGIGYIVRYVSGGIQSYVPTVLLKVKFDLVNTNATTQGENVDYQSATLSGKVFRADNANHEWKWIGDDYATEAEAEAKIKELFSIS